jgi:Uma2 family endonuclease
MTEITSAPDVIIYPEADGLPMTESDVTRDYLTYCVEVLRLYFQSRRNVYVSGNLFLYYQEGNPRAVISPDVFVVFGVSHHRRRSYKAWQEEGKMPSFVMEITSMTTRRQDEIEKPKLYASLGIQEYFQYDQTADYLTPQLKGSHLVEGSYQPLTLEVSAENIPFMHSPMLGLDLQLRPQHQSILGLSPLAQELRFYDRQTGLILLNREEVEQELDVVQQQRNLAQQERDLAQQERDLVQQRADQLAAKLRELGIDPDQMA